MDYPDSMTRIEFDMGEVHNLSLEVLEVMQETGADVGIGVVTLALCMARLLSPKSLTADEEVKFIESMVEYGGTYFATGGVN